MSDPFNQIQKNREKWTVKWVSRTFAGPNTFRMLPKRKAQQVREFLIRRIGDGRTLSAARGQSEYDRKHLEVVARLQRDCKLPFGHVVKLANLYLKELATRRGVLSDKRSKQIYRFAHVPLDRIVLRRMLEDFGGEAVKCGLKKTTAIKSLKETQYDQLQVLLRKAANRAGLNPIDYDLWWAVAKR